MTGIVEKLQYSQFNGGVYIFVVFDNKQTFRANLVKKI